MKKIIYAILILGVMGGGYAYYLYNKPVAKTENLDAAYSLEAQKLFAEFESNEADANQKYLGKILQVKGTVRDVSISETGELNLILDSGSDMFGINCGMSSGQQNYYQEIQVGDTIDIKGECSGMSLDVVLTRCIVVK